VKNLLSFFNQHSLRWEIIIVDDGSRDETSRAVAENEWIKIIRFPRNSGKGAAVRAGMLEARGKVRIFTDADLPSVSYLMMVDVIYIVSMAYILFAMGYSVFASRRTTQESAEAVLKALDRRMGISSLVLYVVVIAIVVTWYLTHYRAGMFG